MWILYAFLSSITAALVAIFAKLGLKNIDSTLATSIRAIIMAIFVFFTALALGKFHNFHFNNFTSREWIYIALSGVAGALSWIFYFLAIKYGSLNTVVAIDKASVIFVIVLAAVVIGDALTWKSASGALLMALGAILIAFSK